MSSLFIGDEEVALWMVRLDAGSEVHALDADGFFRRLGLGDALSGDVEGRPVFGRRDGVGHTRPALSLSTRLYD